MLLNGDIVDNEKPNGTCSPNFVVNAMRNFAFENQNSFFHQTKIIFYFFFLYTQHSPTFVVGLFCEKVNSYKSLFIFAKKHHRRFLTGFQARLLAICQKISHLKDISPVL